MTELGLDDGAPSSAVGRSLYEKVYSPSACGHFRFDLEIGHMSRPLDVRVDRPEERQRAVRPAFAQEHGESSRRLRLGNTKPVVRREVERVVGRIQAEVSGEGGYPRRPLFQQGSEGGRHVKRIASLKAYPMPPGSERREVSRAEPEREQ